jgi:uncharacterized protein YdaU (DUF1376 family)
MSADKFKSPPWYDFYPERFIAGTVAMDAAERGMYISLLCHQWIMEGLPDDMRTLERLAGAPLTPAVLAKFPVGDDGLRRNARLESVRQDQRDRIEKGKARGRKAAAARWSGDASAMLEQCTSNAQAMLEQCHPHSLVLNPHSSLHKPVTSESEGAASASPAPAPKEPKAKRVRFSKPTVEEWTEYAKTMPNALTENQAIGAWDHYEANGWRVGRNPMVDWRASLRKWGSNQREFSQASRPQHKPPVSRNGSGFVMTEQQRIDLDADSLPDNI